MPFHPSRRVASQGLLLCALLSGSACTEAYQESKDAHVPDDGDAATPGHPPPEPPVDPDAGPPDGGDPLLIDGGDPQPVDGGLSEPAPLGPGFPWIDEDDCEPSSPLSEPARELVGSFAELAGVKEVRGNLTLRLTHESPSSLPDLTNVFGKLTIVEEKDADGPSTLELPRLTQVGGLTVTETVHLTALSLPELTRVDCHVRIQNNYGLDKLDEQTWPKLVRIDGALEVGTCFRKPDLTCPAGAKPELTCAINALTELVLPELSKVTNVDVGDNPRLTRFAAPKLAQASDISIRACGTVCGDEGSDEGWEDVACRPLPAFSSMELPALAHAEEIHARYLPKMSLVSLPALKGALGVGLEYLGSSAAPLDIDLGAAEHIERLAVGGEYPNCRECRDYVPSSIGTFDLDSLVTVDSLYVTTPVSAVDLHSLSEANYLTFDGLVDAFAPQAFASLTKVSHYVTFGAVNTLPVFPKLAEFESIRVTAQKKLVWNCDEVLPAFKPDNALSMALKGRFTSVTCDRQEVAGLYLSDSAVTQVAMPAMTSGSLSLARNKALTTVEVPLLADINRFEALDNAALKSLNFPDLIHASTFTIGSCEQLSTLSLPNLTALRNHGSLEIGGTALASIELPKLQNGGELMVIGGNPALTSLNVPVLDTAVGLLIRANPKLTQLALKAQGSMSWLELNDNEKLASLSSEFSAIRRLTLEHMPAIKTLTLEKLTTLEALRLVDNETLQSVSLPQWGPSATYIEVLENPVLSIIAAPSLESATSLTIEQNPAFKQCDAEAWAQTLGTTCTCSANQTCN